MADFFTLLQKSLSPFCPLSHSAQWLLEREREREREKEAGRGREGGREIVRVSNWLAYLSTRRREEKLLRRATKTINSYYYEITSAELTVRAGGVRKQIPAIAFASE